MAEREEDNHLSSVAVDIAVAILALLAGLALLGVYAGDLFSWYESFLTSLYSFNWGGLKLIFQIIFYAFDALLLGLLIFTLLRYNALVGGKSPPEAIKEEPPTKPKEEVAGAWKHISDLAASSNPSDWNMAVLRADALLDEMLIDLGLEGDTMADRLKIMDPTRLPSIERVWSAHRLRNMIAHDPLEQHTKETILTALRSYIQAFKELGLMENTTEDAERGGQISDDSPNSSKKQGVGENAFQK